MNSMEAFFPLNAGISELRCIIKLAKDNGNAIVISKLAKETKRGIDVLLPHIDAGRLLGICTVEKGVITLTSFGTSLTTSNIHKALKTRLARIEPFKSSLGIIKSQKSITTKKLSAELEKEGIMLYSEKSMNEEVLKALFLKWAVRLKLFSYDPKSDAWQIA